MKYFLYSCFFIFNVCVSFAQFSPSFRNYSVSDYRGGNKNWGVSIGDDERVYVANTEGLLEYDGIRWRLWELPNKSIVRSVLVVGDKIYTGAFEEFGFWKRDVKGELKYTSLTIDSKEYTFDQEYWQIVAYKGSVFFRSFSKVYEYRNDKIKLISNIGTITFCKVVNDELLMYSSSKGIMKYGKGGFHPVEEVKFNERVSLKGIEVLKDSSYILSTSLKGCFVVKEGKLNTWETPVNLLLKRYELNSCLKLKSGNLVFGTIKNGTYITNQKGEVLYHLNKNRGLLNNTVLAQNVSSKDRLWICLDNGLSSVDLSINAKVYNDINGDLGAVYDVIEHNNILYVGSNTGLYYMDQNFKLQFIEGSQGQVWQLKLAGKDLLCGHNKGTFLVEGYTVKKISNFNGGWTSNVVPRIKKVLIQGTYGGLVRLERRKGIWKGVKVIGYRAPAKYLVFEDDFTAWVAHPYKGLSRIKFSTDYKRVVSSKSYENKGLFSPYGLKVLKIKNNIVFQTREGWQRYETLQDTIVSFDLLSRKIGKDSFIITDSEESKIAVKTEESIYIKPSFTSEEVIYVPNELYKNRLVSGYERVRVLKDSLYALCLTGGFTLYKGAFKKQQQKIYAPNIESVKVKGRSVGVENDLITTDYKDNKIFISLSSSASKDYFFEYKLLPRDQKWKRSDTGNIVFLNLFEGSYKIHYRTRGVDGGLSDESILTYVVKAPWYRGVLGVLLYFCVFLMFVLLVFLYNRRKLKRKQNLLKLTLEKEQKILLKEKELENVKNINSVKNEALANEVKLKSKQLANTAMALVKKNEILVFLKNELLANKENFDNRFIFKRMIKQIDNSIDHEDEWELFEYNFNQVHKEFFEMLRSNYPSLTHKDLKICAYIKMSLSTKEIAPLLNISARGVETHRYRLKKKLALSKEESLSSFLQNFN